MRWIPFALLCVCSGCTVTCNVSGKWNEADMMAVETIKQQHAQMKGGLVKMADELRSAPDSVDALNTILRKYGIERK